MRDVNFELSCIQSELPAIQLDNGTWLFHAHTVCLFADVSNKINAARWIGDNIPKKWTQEFKRKDQIGRPALYLLLPGFLYVLSRGNSEIALKFRDEVYEVMLPSIIERGGYLSDHLKYVATADDSEIVKIQDAMDVNHLIKNWVYDCVEFVSELDVYVSSADCVISFGNWLKSKNISIPESKIFNCVKYLRKHFDWKYKTLVDNRVTENGKRMRVLKGVVIKF